MVTTAERFPAAWKAFEVLKFSVAGESLGNGIPQKDYLAALLVLYAD